MPSFQRIQLSPRQPMVNNLTIIVAIFNGSNHITPFFDRISKYHHEFQWIFVNDSSNDDSHLIIKKSINDNANMTALSLPENKGPFQARLHGVKNCRTKFWTYIDIDDDIELEALCKYNRATYYNYAPIFKLDYVDENFTKLGRFKTKSHIKYNDGKLKNYPTWEFPACGIYETEPYLAELGHLINAPYNFDEYSFRHYHTILNKPIQQINVTYSYVVEGDSLSRSFSPKRLSYYKSITLIRRELCKKRYKVAYFDVIIDTTRLARNDIRQICKSNMTPITKLKFLSSVLKKYFASLTSL